MTVTYHDLVSTLRRLGLDRQKAVIAHASLSAFGEVRGGAETILGALMMSSASLVMPVFTFKTMLIPESGPQDNGILYGSGGDLNRMAEFFSPQMPADPLMGIVAETLRCHPLAKRSGHPILSFAGIHAAAALDAQTIQEPLAPIRVLAEQDGWVVLLGVDHTVNTSIHYAERLAGREQFVRWALTEEGVRECPGYPGCSDGFQAIAPLLEEVAHTAVLGNAQVTALSMTDLFDTVQVLLEENPLALLCERPDCDRCNAVRSRQEPAPAESEE